MDVTPHPRRAAPTARDRRVDVCGPVGLVCAVLAVGLVVAPVGSVLMALPLAAAGLALGIAGIVRTGHAGAGDRGVAVAVAAAAVGVAAAVPLYVGAVSVAFIATTVGSVGAG